MQIAFAGDRDIAVEVLDLLLSHGVTPAALFVVPEPAGSHGSELVSRCPGIPPDLVFWGTEATSPATAASLNSLNLDYLIAIHFPLVLPERILSIPRRGTLNLHPSLLPFNRGWHTPSWTILDGTPAGATLHLMDGGVDTGDIVWQRQLDVRPCDTAHTLYQRLKRLELEVFREALPSLTTGTFQRLPQEKMAGTRHRKSELHSPDIQRLDLSTPLPPEAVLRRIRALTTNRWDEAAYFDIDGRRYRVRIEITPDDPRPHE
jgi:methionyl-tRNA formyltransferase